MAYGMLKAASTRNQGYDGLDVIHPQGMTTMQREMEVGDCCDGCQGDSAEATLHPWAWISRLKQPCGDAVPCRPSNQGQPGT